MSHNIIAFFTDRAMLPGLHAALLSMLKSNSGLDVDTIVFSDGITESDIDLLRATWSIGNPASQLFVRPFKPIAIGNTLHGNATTWGRIFLGELLPDYNKCIYLDCDLIVNTSLEPLFGLLTDDVLLGADCTGDREWSLDKDLFVDANIGLDGKCFNAGVLALNLDGWRSSNAFEHCKVIAERFAGRFASADQALLNVAFHDRVVAFGDKYNSPLYSYDASPSPLDERIYHFVGSPKPWDFLGSSLHNSFHIWHSVFAQTAIGNHSVFRYLNPQRVIRTSKQLFNAWKAQRAQRSK